MINKIIYILIILFSFDGIAQKNEIKDSVKSITEKITYLIEEPILEQNCLDCDSDSFYQFGTFLVTTPEIFEIHFKNDWITTKGSTYKNSYKEFNIKNQKTKEIWFEHDNSKKEEFLYEYDDKNNNVRTINISHEDYYQIDNFYYDYKNRLVSENSSYSNTFIYKINNYDSLDRKTKTDIYDENGYNHTDFYNYNDIENSVLVENNVAIIKTKDSITNSTTSITTTSLEKKPVHKKYFNKEKKVTEYQQYMFDEKLNKSYIHETIINTFLNNKLILRKEIGKDYTIEDSFGYNEYGKIKKYTRKTPWKENNETIEYFYLNNLLSKIEIKRRFNNKKDNFTLTFDYKFDEKSNWIEQTKSVNSIPTYIWKREIKYYN